MSPDTAPAILESATWQLVSVLLGGIATIAIFSFLFKENPFYRFFEHTFIGIGVGLGIVQGIKTYLWPLACQPVFYAIMGWSESPDGTPVSRLNLLFLIPMLFGMLYYCIYSKKYSWLSRLVIGFSLGIGGGLALKSFCAEVMPQIIGSFKPLAVWNSDGKFDLGSSASNIIFVITLLSVMTYFFFSVDHDKPVLKQVSTLGRWLMMVCFGAFFGTTVMARMALMVERLDFLTEKWWPAIYSLFH